MTSEVAGEVPPLSVYLRPELGADALLGLPGEIAVRCAKATGADVAACLLATLVMIGNAAGAEPHVQWGADHPGRLFVVVVGETGSLKTVAIEAVRELFRDADPLWESRRVKGGLQSPQAMIKEVSDDRDDPRLLIYETEFARLAGQMARTDWSPYLRQAWDGKPPLENEPSKGGAKATHPHISLIVLITPREMEKYHKRLSESGGLENRLLFCHNAPAARVSRAAARTADYGDLIDRLRSTLELSRSTVLESTDPISRAIFLERGTCFQPSTELPLHDKVVGQWDELVTAKLPRTDADDVATLWTRAEDQVTRLAAAYAIGCGSDTVAVEHIQAAVALWAFCAHSAEVFLSVAAGQGTAGVNRIHSGKIMDHLRRKAGKGDGWVTATEINKAVFGGNVKAAQIRPTLDWLVSKGLVEGQENKTGGRPAQSFRIARRP
jgi:Protein of unknown function (DUF3987)